MAPYHPVFKKDSVLRRPDDGPYTNETVQPGVHACGSGTEAYSVVWWDPHALGLGKEASFGIRRESLISKDVSPAVVEDGVREFQRWQARKAEAIATSAVPSVAVRTATEWAADPGSDLVATAGTELFSAASAPRQGGLFDDVPLSVPRATAEEPPVSVLDLRGTARPGGARFGELVHAVLATTPLGAHRDACADASEVQARILGAPEAERDAAAEAVIRVLAHDLMRRAAVADAGGRARRECPVTVLAPEGTLIEGVVDLAFEDGGRWVVIDFKTDREISQDGIERYRRQVALYATAITRATGLPADATLIRV